MKVAPKLPSILWTALAVIVHCLPTAAASTLHEYADKVFIPYLEKQLQGSRRLDSICGISQTTEQGDIQN